MLFLLFVFISSVLVLFTLSPVIVAEGAQVCCLTWEVSFHLQELWADSAYQMATQGGTKKQMKT